MARYVWDRAAQRLVDVTQAARVDSAPQIMPDIPAYKSPLGTGWITSRSHRREELKRSGCREVDPSEHRAAYRNPHFASKRGLNVTQD